LAGLAFILVGAIFAALLPLPLALMGAEVLCLLIPALVFRKAFAPPQGGWPTIKPAQPWWWIVIACITAGALGMSINAIAALSTHLSPTLAQQAAEYSAQTRSMLLPEQNWLMIAAHLSVIVFAPVTEEALFRAAMLPAQRAHLPAAAACLLNGLLFAAFHFSWLVLLPLTLLGAYLAWLTLRARSPLPAILGHATMNALSVTLLHGPPTAPAHTLSPLDLALPLLTAGPVAIALLALLHHTARPATE
jgi:membrane protease YdiL (CAAX protease family)